LAILESEADMFQQRAHNDCCICCMSFSDKVGPLYISGDILPLPPSSNSAQCRIKLMLGDLQPDKFCIIFSAVHGKELSLQYHTFNETRSQMLK